MRFGKKKKKEAATQLNTSKWVVLQQVLLGITVWLDFGEICIK